MMAESTVVKGLTDIYSRIDAACLKTGLAFKPRLVAVSKTKPKELVIEAYEHGQRNFGENYIQELFDKSNESQILERCKDIRWHFIGNLQKNKVNKLIGVPGLYAVETVDSEKLATVLDKAWSKSDKKELLNVMVQVNTSGEESKNGCTPVESVDLVKHVLEKCPSLKFIGLMTIGQYIEESLKGPNKDFLCLKKCREEVAEKLNLSVENIELSMGMSHDFEHAIELGSTSVRVGTAIFGTRNVNQKEENADK